MRIAADIVCETTQQSLAGSTSLAISTISGVTWLTVVIPILLRGGNIAPPGSSDTRGLIVVIGSGIAMLFALLSFGLERRIGPAAGSLCVLAVTENVLLPVMPFWTVMVLGHWSAWAAVAYAGALIAALALIVQRLTTGRVMPPTPFQFSRCPLVGALRKP
jgi:hypothetical protein